MRILRYVQRNSAGDELREYWLATCRQDILAMRHAADCQCLSGVQPCAKIESCAITGEDRKSVV